MQLNLAKEFAALKRMTVRELRLRYADVFDEPTRAGNKAWLIKRVAWRLQSRVEGDISERARKRAMELADDADIRLSPPKEPPAASKRPAALIAKTDDRLPPPGTHITREYKGLSLEIEVLANGFAFEGERYKSLSAVAKAITGQHCNGYAFFGLRKEPPSK